MQFRLKLFLAMLFSLLAILSVMSLYFLEMGLQGVKANYATSLKDYSELVSQSFQMMEREHKVRAERTLKHVRTLPIDSLRKPTLKALSELFGLSYLAVIGKNGVFQHDTGPTEVPQNDKTLFDFCPGYRDLFQNPQKIESTPVIISHPDRTPYMFFLARHQEGTHLVEIGQHLSYISSLLASTLESRKDVARIGFFTASGDLLGKLSRTEFAKSDAQSERLTDVKEGFVWSARSVVLTLKVPTIHKDCCECRVKNLADAQGNYFYYLQIESQLSQLQALEKSTQNFVVTGFAAGALICFVISYLLARTLSLRMNSLRAVVAKTKGGEHPDLSRLGNGVDEISSLARAFESLLIRLRAYEKEQVFLKEQAVLASVMQALAHDLRRPFSMFKMTADCVAEMEDPTEIKNTLQDAMPDILRSMNTVNLLIQDVLEVGTDTKLDLKSTNPINLVQCSLIEVFQAYPECVVDIDSEFSFTREVRADHSKMGRVVANILTNAIQAMKFRGKIWIKITDFDEEKRPQVKFSVRNEGSFIEPENIAQIFDAFFTSGKKGGTGLGLAISKKIIEAHGGKIWCRSEKNESQLNGFVEFSFTLNASEKVVELNNALILSNSSEILSASKALRKKPQSDENILETTQIELTIEDEIFALCQGLSKKHRIVVTDDESLYRKALKSLVTRSELLSEYFEVVEAQTSAECTTQVLECRPILVILDFDLGPHSLNGVETQTQLRESGYTGIICIHSNRFPSEDLRPAFDEGANTVVPKPMSRIHFLKVLKDALQKSQS
jgi:signal transduction histidine kinase/CheY-like chemotaxis protein